MTTLTTSRELLAQIGSPEPLGATVHADGINFAVYSGATKVSLLIFNAAGDHMPCHELVMNKVDGGKIWHVFVKGLSDKTLYLFRAEGTYDPAKGDRYNGELFLLDPYAHMVTGPSDWEANVAFDNSNPEDPNRHLVVGTGGNTNVMPKCVALAPSTFDWQGDKSPNTPMAETVVYEVSVAGFTGNHNSGVSYPGTYLGFVEKMSHIKDVGFTGVEFMPIAQWYRKTSFINPKTGRGNKNAWGYNTIVFGAPDEGLASRPGEQSNEFKLVVRELHKIDLEVYLDKVFNHSAENHEVGGTFSFRGLDNKTYYMLVPDNLALYKNYSGCGNTVNVNNPVVRKLILDCLRWWVTEFHVDGFRFDLAAIFGIKEDFTVSADSPVLREMAACPILSRIKLFPEPWALGVYLMGQFRAPMCEWNGRFRDDVREFVKSDAGMVSKLATAVSGSQDRFGSDGTRLPVNFVTVHDGFSLMDLVSYNGKHNEANGEENRDGESHNRSWNCGHEGSDLTNAPLSDDEKRVIDALRRKQIKNFLTLLLVSRGVPLILYGDEMGRTNLGNNNPYCQVELNQLDWELVTKNPDLLRYTRMMVAFRKAHCLGGRGHNPVFRNIVWHGAKPLSANWQEWSRLLAWELEPFKVEGESADQAVYVATNAHWEPTQIELPEGNWYRIVDTSLASGQDIVADDEAQQVGGSLTLQPRSTIVLVRK